jgi:polyhydroxybutyrate depolymerase
VSERNWRAGWPVAAGLVLGLAALALGAAEAHAAVPLPPAESAVVARLEQGCGRPPPAVAPGTVEIDGRTRAMITVVPATYRPTQPHALVVAFHGRTNSNAKARRYFGLERAAHGPTIFVYPSGLRDREGRYSWSAPGDPAAALRDYALFDALLAKITAAYCIDPSRIFAVGHSLGAWFANNLACARGDVLRAIGTLAGAISRSPCQGVVAALLFHNPHDRMVAFAYGLEARDVFRRRNGFADVGRGLSLEGFACRRYGDVTAANPVVWCPHDRDRSRSGRYYPHNWPVGTGAAMMAFFATLPDATRASAARALPPPPQG